MSDWIHGLPIGWLTLVIFTSMFLVTAAIYWVVMRLATGDRARTFKGVSPGLLSPLGVLYGLFVAFISVQVWGEVDRANAAVNHEASALRAVVLLSHAFPTDSDARLRQLIAQHIREAHDVEWPAMAHHRATLTMVPTSLADALAVALALPVTGEGQVAAQREIVSQLGNALDARRQRVIVSRGGVGWVKWTALIVQAICTLITITLVHCDDRATARLALGLFGTAVAVSMVLITAYDRPFTGRVGVTPAALLQVQPDSVRPGP